MDNKIDKILLKFKKHEFSIEESNKIKSNIDKEMRKIRRIKKI